MSDLWLSTSLIRTPQLYLMVYTEGLVLLQGHGLWPGARPPLWGLRADGARSNSQYPVLLCVLMTSSSL